MCDISYNFVEQKKKGILIGFVSIVAEFEAELYDKALKHTSICFLTLSEALKKFFPVVCLSEISF